jgi:23S rRNA pseudouridine1911/1915/1917 synthase
MPEGEGAPRAWIVSDEQSGQRLDAWLAARLGVARAEARRLLAGGRVRVDGRRVASRQKGSALAAGRRVEVEAFTPVACRRIPLEPEAPLAVLAEGPGWIAIDKPPGRAVHPLREGERDTLLGALAARHPEVQGVGEGGLRSGVVHRLDVDTSGVMLFATRADAWERLRAAFRAHRVEKVYRAIARGSLRGEGELELALAVVRHRPARVGAAPPGVGRRAQLRWRALEPLRGATLVEVRPRTGFLHQIRASLACLGHPLCGDPVYGGPGDDSGAPRHMLHAARIAVDEIAAESPDAPDFAELLRRLGR